MWSKLKDNGVVVVLDDFGTGYSNLHCLSDLKPDYIKIDRSFTVKALKNHYDYELLTYIIQMTHSLSLSLCIEGVETPEELDELRYRDIYLESLIRQMNSMKDLCSVSRVLMRCEYLCNVKKMVDFRG